jgi:hypothetical protein
VDDFEVSSAVDGMTVTAASGATLSRSFAQGHIGARALGIDYSVTAGSSASVARVLSASQDWSSAKFFNFWFHGTASNNPFRVELLDNRAPGGSGDTSERFEARFTDDFTGWKWVSLPLSAFTRRADGQPAGAPSDGLSLTQMWGYAVSPVSGSGAYRVDQVELEYPLAPAAP